MGCCAMMNPEDAIVEALPRIRAMSRGIANRRGLDADDLEQYAMERLIRQLRNVRRADNLASLAVFRARLVLTSAVKREFSWSLGAEKKHERLDDPESHVVVGQDHQFGDPIAARKIGVVVDGLTPKERAMFEAIYVADSTLAEYARDAGIHQSTAWETHESLLAKFRKSFGVAAPAPKEKRDTTVYKFRSPDGETVEMTRQQFMELTGAASSNATVLLKRRSKSYKGWKLA